MTPRERRGPVAQRSLPPRPLYARYSGGPAESVTTRAWWGREYTTWPPSTRVVSVVAVAFHCERRARVLLRDIFRFGTATSLLLRVVLRQQALQLRPPGVGALVRVRRVVGQACPALGAQTRAVVPAHGLERQGRHQRVVQHGLQVDQVVPQLAQLVILLPVRRAAGVHVQLLDVGLDLVLDLFQAPHALADGPTTDRAGDEDALHHRLEPQIQLEVGVFGYADHLGAETRRCSDRPLDLPHGSRSASQLSGVEDEWGPGVQADHHSFDAVRRASASAPSASRPRREVTARATPPPNPHTHPTLPVIMQSALILRTSVTFRSGNGQ